MYFYQHVEQCAAGSSADKTTGREHDKDQQRKDRIYWEVAAWGRGEETRGRQEGELDA